MNDYQINLTATKKQQIIYAEATGIWFVSGTSDSAENRIKIKFSNSDEFALKPGQSVIGLPKTTTVSITSYDGTSAIDGQIKLGTGKFEDSNIQSTTLIAPGQTVGITGLVRDIYRPEAITGAYADNGSVAANTNVTIVAAGTNVKGVIVHNAQLMWTGTGRQSFLAKATAPASIFDGTVILSQDGVGTSGNYNARDVFLQNPLLIPAGQAIWFRPAGDPNGFFRMLQYTVL